MLLNHSYDSLNCFSLVLVGEPYLNHILDKQVHEALRQRITVHYNYVKDFPIRRCRTISATSWSLPGKDGVFWREVR